VLRESRYSEAAEILGELVGAARETFDPADSDVSLQRGLADAADVTYSAAMLRALADALDHHAQGMT
jgi:hypothetical protein